MAEFPSAVNAPGGISYAAPLMNFSNFSNWAADDPYKKIFDQQARTLNQQRITQGQQAIDLTKVFQQGLPKGPDGQIDYAAAAQMLAKFGDVGNAVTLLQQAPPPASPLLGGGAPVVGGAGAGPPTSVESRPLPPPSASSPRGDTGTGSITDIVTDRLPSQNMTTGQTILKIAEVMGVDPNATLTPGQLRRAQGLLQKYAPEIAGVGGGTGSAVPVATGGGASPAPAVAASDSGSPASFGDRFSAATDGGTGDLPPSANAVSPAPRATAPQAPRGGTVQPQPGPAVPVQGPSAGTPVGPQGPAAVPSGPQAAPPQPLVPQVPLPKGFTDPQQAILALGAEAAKYRAMPGGRGLGTAMELDNYAKRIEASIQPVEISAGKTLLDPKTAQPIYQGNQPTLSPEAINGAAERYLETGQLPPNLGRGTQGSATMTAIQNHAAELANQRGIDMATLPAKWQQFKAQQVAIQRFTSGPQGNTIRSFNVLVDHLETLAEAGAALKNGDIRAFNRWKQAWATQTGESAPTSFDGVKALVGDEIVKAVVGSAGALADREEVKKDLDRVSSPKQLADLIEKYNKLALGQLKGLRKQYEVSTGLKNFGDLLLPGTLAALGGGSASAPDASQAGSSAKVSPAGVNWSIVQ